MSTVKDRLKALTRDELVARFRTTTEELAKNFKVTQEEMIETFDEKSKDYDIEFYKEVGGYFLLLRIREKYHRLHNLLLKEGKPSCEPIEDTIKDLSTILTSLYSMLMFDLVSMEQLKRQYAQAMQVDIDEVIAKEDAKKAEAEKARKKSQKKWWQVWK